MLTELLWPKILQFVKLQSELLTRDSGISQLLTSIIRVVIINAARLPTPKQQIPLMIGSPGVKMMTLMIHSAQHIATQIITLALQLSADMNARWKLEMLMILCSIRLLQPQRVMIR